VLLVSVPYAFKAHEAETLGGLPASAFVKTAETEFNAAGIPPTATSPITMPGMSGSKLPPLTPKNTIAKFFGSGLCCTGANVVEDTFNPKLNVAEPLNLTQLNYGYKISGSDVLAMHNGGNLAVGIGACVSPGTGSTGVDNTCVGNQSGFATGNGIQNTFVGAYSGWYNGTGNNNTFVGDQAGFGNTKGDNNSFFGFEAGYFTGTTVGIIVASQTGMENTFTGAQAGFANSGGSQNTFSGFQAGYNNQVAQENTSFGYRAGYNNTCDRTGYNCGSYNTFVGGEAGEQNYIGSENTFAGFLAGGSNGGDANAFYGVQAGQTSQGSQNSFFGTAAGLANVGSYNTFVGEFAGFNNQGQENTFLGSSAAISHATGDNNIYIGARAGETNSTGGNDIYVGNLGASTEDNVIRIGTTAGTFPPTHTDTYIAGIYQSSNLLTVNYPVCIDANHKLVSQTACNPGSSIRYKERVETLGEWSARLFQLRPVTFFYRAEYDDGSHSRQFGLIAEEVAKVYPELAVFDKDGQPSGVKYQMLAPMLLNELQKEHTVVMAQQDEMQTQLQQIKAQGQEIETLKLQLQRQNASLQLKNASLEERLTKLESYITTQTKVASDNRSPAPGVNGGRQ
jgi:trimeric autotransporter adhesin